MKKNQVFFGVSCLFMCLSVIFTSGCKNNPDGLQQSSQDEKEYEYGIIGKKASELNKTDKQEIATLHGTYWPNGEKNMFVSIDSSGLSICSNIMSIRYQNILWHKNADGNWLCSAYHQNITDYARTPKRAVLLFKKTKDEKLSLMLNIVAMGESKYGPFEKKQEPVLKKRKDTEGQDRQYYVYADDPKYPEITFPTQL